MRNLEEVVVSNTSRITDAMNGMTITERITPAVNTPKPFGVP